MTKSTDFSLQYIRLQASKYNFIRTKVVLAIQDPTDIIRTQQNKKHNIVTTLAQLQLDYTRESQGLTEMTTQGYPGPARENKKRK